MKLFLRITSICLVPLSLTAAGCESISLISRADPMARNDRRDADIDRNRDVQRNRDLDRSSDEIAGTVQRVDSDRQEIQVRTTDGQLTRIRYDISTRVSNRDRDMRVDDLRNGDLVRIELSNRDRGERYATVIRMNDRGDLGLAR